MLRQSKIGSAELEILSYVTERHPITVGEVAEHFANTKGHARTTILTVMERLRKKGFLTRLKTGGVFEYSPTTTKKELTRSLVRDFIDQALGGSLAPFVAYLTECAELSDEDIKDLERLVADLEKREERTS